MSSLKTAKEDYESIMSFREGAHFCKMDLHTHTPASECSSFSLPPQIEKVFTKVKPKTVAWYKYCYSLLKDIGKNRNPFKDSYADPTLDKRPRLSKRPPLKLQSLRDIAQYWLKQIQTRNGGAWPELTKEQKTERKELIHGAMLDLRKYLESLFFPEEYVIRCYIEGIQIAAITDHNHPGYIVPRVPPLGTWFAALQSVNENYTKDINDTSSLGENVRKVILARLNLALTRLDKGCEEKSEVTAAIRKLHDESDEHEKILKALKDRKAHIEERIQYWSNYENRPAALAIIPGVELTVSNVHLLSLFPAEWYVPGRIGSILRTIGIPEEHWGKGFFAAASSSVQDTISLVYEEGGIVIPAHSNSDFKGLLRLFEKGLALNKVLEHDALLSLETIGGSVIAGKGKKKPGKDTCETLKWLESGSSRPDREMLLSFVKGSDAHEFRIELDGTGEDMGSRFSYVKMDIRPKDTAEEVFRSLRLALISGQSRVIEHPPEDGYSYHNVKEYRIDKDQRLGIMNCMNIRPTILGVTAYGQGAYTHDLQVRFNPFLNCVVGSDGKTTLIRLVAYAFGALGFADWTKTEWLPEEVRAFWKEGEKVYCIERIGRSSDPNAPGVKATWYELGPDGTWSVKHDSHDDNIRTLANKIDIWPQGFKATDNQSEDYVISELVRNLETGDILTAKPLLVCQTHSIFNSKKIFDTVLSRPFFKGRQIIWSTFSPNVPTALDSEKIIVIGEKSNHKQLEILCGGDLHEDEIRERFLNEFEGGWSGFARRSALYSI